MKHNLQTTLKDKNSIATIGRNEILRNVGDLCRIAKHIEIDQLFWGHLEVSYTFYFEQN